jgi:hypothetical protein
MRDYARQQTAILLRRLAYQLNRAARNGDADSIHDLRIAIRRLSRCLRVFAPFFPADSWKKIRRRLAELMEATGRPAFPRAPPSPRGWPPSAARRATSCCSKSAAGNAAVFQENGAAGWS